MKILFLLLLVPFELCAQDITGVWSGRMYNDTTHQSIRYELAISRDQGKLTGYSRSVFILGGVENIGVKSLKIKKSEGDAYSIEDSRLLYDTYTIPPPRGVRVFAMLRLIVNDSEMVLQGPWTTNVTRRYNRVTGNLLLIKKRDLARDTLVKNLRDLGLAGTLSFISPPVEKIPNPPSLEAGSGRAPARAGATDTIKTVAVQKTTATAYTEIKNEVSRTPPVKSGSTGEKVSAGSTAITASSKPGGIREQARDSSLQIPERKAPLATRAGATDTIKAVAIQKTTTTAFTDRKNEASPPLPVKPGSTGEKPPAGSTAITASSTPGSVRELARDSTTKIPESGAPLPAARKPVPVAAAAIHERKIETIRSVEIQADSLVLTLYDNGVVDGDTVSVLLNGKVVMPRVGLSLKPVNKTIYLTPQMGDSLTLIMYAENLGSIPPNTGLLIVHDGDKVHYINFSGDLHRNAAILLRRMHK
ncbi:MAG: hypothetical protein KGM98_06105 [Bacteroidota bacterium]|nr:hypothetical protein [Bacteroidota bacterium]